MQDGHTYPEVDVVVYQKNRERTDPESLIPYEGKWVAFSGDGLTVVATAGDLSGLLAELDAMGRPVNSVGLEYIPTPEELGCPCPHS
jgi:hypothetical protein